MVPLLVGDVGGTGTRLAVVGPDGLLSPVTEYRNDDFVAFADLLERHCAALRTAAGELPPRCVLAVAGPVRENAVQMTNRGWRLDGAGLAERCGLEQVQIVNDFAALAWATLHFTAADLEWLGAARPDGGASKVVLGPGTGLGVAALVPAGAGWTAVTGEGGHVTLAASTDEEARVIAHLREHYGHCSAERLLSGPGLSDLAHALGYGRHAPEVVGQWIAGETPSGRHTARVFAELLATVASDLALTFDARGGVYLGGGILPRLGAAFPVAAFTARFASKGRYSAFLAALPVARIVRPYPAFAGLPHLPPH
ncbi:MAG: glucokinase [Gammaproteobacteria bacterium]|jgi:glucokinase|nr:glucokinase [Gammaproteobacteria bacterium]